jgi:uncharacterized DUF497 family protein
MAELVRGFDWDAGNWPKCAKHGLTKHEIESVFHLGPAVHADPATGEQRLRAIGRSRSRRYVFVVFTLRNTEDGTYIRPISARYMHQKEIDRYERG